MYFLHMGVCHMHASLVYVDDWCCCSCIVPCHVGNHDILKVRLILLLHSNNNNNNNNEICYLLDLDRVVFEDICKTSSLIEKKRKLSNAASLQLTVFTAHWQLSK